MEKEDKAFSIATDMVKLLITLSTGVITFTVTFSKDIFGDLSNMKCIWLLMVSWIIFTLSMVLGFSTLGAMVGTLSKASTEPSSDGNNPPNMIYSPNIKRLCCLQIFLFLLGLIIVFILGYINLSKEKLGTKENGVGLRIVRTSSYSLIDSSRIDTIFIPVKKI